MTLFSDWDCRAVRKQDAWSSQLLPGRSLRQDVPSDETLQSYRRLLQPLSVALTISTTSDPCSLPLRPDLQRTEGLNYSRGWRSMRSCCPRSITALRFANPAPLRALPSSLLQMVPWSVTYQLHPGSRSCHLSFPLACLAAPRSELTAEVGCLRSVTCQTSCGRSAIVTCSCAALGVV